MAVALLIVVVIAFAVASFFFIAPRRPTTTRRLSRETRRRDRQAARSSPGAAAPSTELELSAEARHRAEEARPHPTPAARTDHAPVVWEPVDAETVGVTRRHFLNGGILATMGLILSTFGVSVLAFIWPSSASGFGGKIAAGRLSDILAFIKANKQPFYVPEARTYIQPYPANALPAAKKVYPDFIYANMEQGIVALYQRCTHLGCRVPWCQSSQWFECPCHGSKYNRVGEKRDGPTPRGLDRFQAIIAAGNVTVNTGLLAIGPPIGTDTTGQVADGPHCVG
jgi:cytochrome b6-f complex iron-sulfur subunit